MKNKKINVMIAVLIFIIPGFFTIISSASVPCTVSGYVYANNELIDPEKIILSFQDKDITADLFENSFYVIDFNGDVGDKGNFIVTYKENDYIANETITIILGEISYEIDLHITIVEPENKPPDKPINPTPSNNSKNISRNPKLKIYVSDPDNDKLKVQFFNKTSNNTIETFNNVDSNSYVECIWYNLSYNTSYNWYVKVSDTEFSNTSDAFYFKTKEKENNPPKINITFPKNNGLYFKDKVYFKNLLKFPIIIGDITIKVNATDDYGIKKVTFYTVNYLETKETILGNDTEAPYEYNFLNNRPFIKLLYIKAVAEDINGKTSFDKILVLKIL